MVSSSGRAASLTSSARGLCVVAALVIGAGCGGEAQPADRTLRVAPSTGTLRVGDTRTFLADEATVDGSAIAATDAVWDSSDVAVATVVGNANGSATVTGVGVGTAQITVTSGMRSASATVTVTRVEIVRIEISPSEPVVPAGYTVSLVAIGVFSDHHEEDLTSTANWRSFDQAVATVTSDSVSKGVVHGLIPGQATIMAAFEGATAAIPVTVTDAVLVAIEVSSDVPSVAVGAEVSLRAMGTFSDGSTRLLTDQVTWGSADPDVATVSNEAGEEGVMSGLTHGGVKVTATRDGITGTKMLTVI